MAYKNGIDPFKEAVNMNINKNIEISYGPVGPYAVAENLNIAKLLLPLGMDIVVKGSEEKYLEKVRQIKFTQKKTTFCSERMERGNIIVSKQITSSVYEGPYNFVITESNLLPSVGVEVEFNMFVGEEFLPAADYFGGVIVDDDLGTDGSGQQLEIRIPPVPLCRNGHLIEDTFEVADKIVKSVFSLLSEIDDTDIDIYAGAKPSETASVHLHVELPFYITRRLSLVLGYYLIPIFQKRKKMRIRDRWRTGYGDILDVRSQPWGSEIRFLPNFFFHPLPARMIMQFILSQVIKVHKTGNISLKDVDNDDLILLEKIERIFEKVSTVEEIKVPKPPRMSSELKSQGDVIFSDDTFDSDVKEVLKRIFRTSCKNYYFYGLKKDRGLVVAVAAGDDSHAIDPYSDDEEVEIKNGYVGSIARRMLRRGYIAIGLPYELRINAQKLEEFVNNYLLHYLFNQPSGPTVRTINVNDFVEGRLR